MQERTLGTTGLVVSTLGLGCSGMSSDYGVPDDVESTATIRHAIDRGVTLFDSSDAYGGGHNETLIGEAIRGRREGLVIATKFGNMRGPNGQRGITNGRPDYVPVACERSLSRLGVDVIDLYYIHRIDPEVPIEDTIGAMARLVDAGKVRHIGICEAGVQTIRRAHAVHPLAAVQMEYSLWSRDAETDILPTLRELGIGLVAYSPLGRGFLTGAFAARDDLIPSDRRHAHPRFQEGNFEQNLALLESIKALASARGATPAQIALAWILAQDDGIVPIPGTKRRTWLDQNLGALDVHLSASEINDLSQALPPDSAAGFRYPEAQLKKLGI